MISRFFITALLSSICITVSAQEYKPFRVGIGTGWITPSSDMLFNLGFLLYAEPSWHFNKKISTGFRIETAARLNEAIGIIGSYTINTQYYFTDRAPRFFGGIGGGVYTLNTAPGMSCSCTGEPESKLSVAGFYPRLGFEYRRLVFTAEYNIIQYPSTNYLALKAGIFIGKKKR